MSSRSMRLGSDPLADEADADDDEESAAKSAGSGFTVDAAEEHDAERLRL
jgi:hypothetical protein